MPPRVAVICLVLSLAAAGCGGSDDEPGRQDGAGPSAASDTGAKERCTPVEQPPSKRNGKERKPRTQLERGKSYSITFSTNCGDFTVKLDQGSAPRAAASLVALAKRGFFDGTTFHRVVPGFVIQGGDPTASGTGGPGYKTVDRPPSGARYTKGVVAMAKAGDEPAGSAGSQFFVVIGDDAGLPADYAVVGKVSRGLDVVERIGSRGDAATEEPTEPLVIQSASVSTS